MVPSTVPSPPAALPPADCAGCCSDPLTGSLHGPPASAAAAAPAPALAVAGNRVDECAAMGVPEPLAPAIGL
jgi:hypothetical protein